MSEDRITIEYTLSKEDLICSVCLDELTCPIIQCPNGNHFVCAKCLPKMQRKCPLCRTSKLFRNKFLEVKLEPSMIPCSNYKCNKLLLPWSEESHFNDCKYTETNCFLCDSLVSLASLMEHIKTECDTEWLENDGNATSGNASLVMHQVGSGNHNVIKMPDTKANVSLISNKIVLMLKWEDDVGYHVALIDCEQDSSKTDIHYMLKPNSHSIIHSRMSLTSANTLQEVKSIECYAHLLLEVEEIIVRKNAHSEYGGNTGVNRFISNLLVQ